MAKRLVKLPTGSRPIGPLPIKRDLSNVVYVRWTEPNREVIELKDSKVIFVDFQNGKKIGHAS